ncbi:MAG: BatA domain-containing protein [Gemmatimonadetes bacterium]|nr:BatA domain-containing protein [Gemmatimonadota bacterium]
MTWGAPIALVGLALLAFPILIHMMGLGRATVRPFPSLRFLEAARLLPSRRTRIHDAALLALRLAVLAVAVFALARPSLGGNVAIGAGEGVVRAVILDTSASMRRETPSGGTAIAAARRTADTLVSAADAAITVATDDPAGAVAGAVAWLASKQGDRELIIVSDFQRGAFDDAAAGTVPSWVSLRGVRIPVQGVGAALDMRFRQGGREVTVRSNVAGGRTQASWTPGSARAVGGTTPTGQGTTETTTLAGNSDGASVRAVNEAALSVGRPIDGPSFFARVVIVYPNFEGRAALLGAATPLSEPWQGALIGQLQSDSLLATSASDAEIVVRDSLRADAAVAARARGGEAVVAAVVDGAGPAARLVLDVRADAGSMTALALRAALARAEAMAPRELEPDVLSDSMVATFDRPATADAPTARPADGAVGDTDAPSLARWFWVLALLALGAEAVYRRSLATRSAVVEHVER